MSASHTEVILARIYNVKWGGEPPKISTDSEVLLMGEFIRRQALWGKTLGIPTTMRVPFDVAKYKEPTIRAKPETLNKLRSHLINVRPIIREIYEWALHWAALGDNDIPSLTEHPDPYEPLLYMFDQGSTFHFDQGINVGGATIPRGNWLSFVDKPPFWLEEEGFTTTLRPNKGS